MSTKTVDERVVQMQFDNKQFETNVSTTLSTLTKLKNALKFDGAARGLEDINSAAGRCNLSGLSNAVETVKTKFSALEIVAITALSNITNTVMNFGSRIVSALSIEPITSGLQEYETQINAVQTILANTSSAQVQVSQQAIQEVNDMAEQSAAAAVRANEQAMASLQKTHSAQLRALSKQATQQSRALQKSQKAQLKEFEKYAEQEQEILEKNHAAELQEFETHASEETEILEKSHEEQIEAYEERAEKELEILEENYDSQTEAFEKSIDEETKLLKKAHNEKLDLYHEEYMEKLKATDEDRYRELKAVDDEIDSLNNLTKAENEERKAAEQQKKLAELRNAVYNASTYEDLLKARERLSDYEEELERERVLKERENRIQELEAQKDAINERYDLVNEQIEAEYKEKKEQENELYEVQSEQLKEQQSQKKKELKKTYEYEKKLMKKRQEEEREALDEKLELEKTELDNRLESERKVITDRQTSEKNALSERLSAERDAISDRQQAERDALSDRQQAEREALTERQEAETEALKSQHEAALKNIEDEKNARLKALRETGKEVKKASTLEDVNKALDELNEYADKTIYNFTEMTRNIGTFTAAGVDLETSVSAIKGIANLAALSGSNSEQASRAMYQLSQAIAAGKVQLQDWNSVVYAGMGGKVFQDALIETARVHGVAIDDMIASEGTFRETLQKGWLTSDILLETLEKFTGDLTEEELRAIGYTEDQITSIMQLGQTAQDAATKIKTFTQLWDALKETAQSGWTNSWEIIIGDFEEAKELWTGVYDVLSGIIEQQADARNAILQGWKDMGGRTVLIEAIKNAFEGVVQVVKIFKSTFETIFPPVTSEKLYAITEGLRDLTSHFKLNDKNASNLAKTFKGLFSAMDIVADIAKGALKSGLKLLKNLFGNANIDILGMTASIGDSISEFRNWIKENDLVTKGFDKLADGITEALGMLKRWFDAFIELPEVQAGLASFGKLLSDITEDSKIYLKGGIERFSEFIERLKEMDTISLDNIDDIFKDFVNNVVGYFTNFRGSFETVKDTISKFKESIKTHFSEVGETFDGLRQKISDFANSVKEFLGDHLGTIISVALSAGLLAIIKKIVDTFSAIGGFVSGIQETIATLGTSLNGLIKSVTKILKANALKTQSQALLRIAASIAILAGAAALLTQLDSGKLLVSAEALSYMAIGLGVFAAALGGMQKLGLDASKASLSLLEMSAALLILAQSLKRMEKLDADSMGNNLKVLASIATGFVVFQAALQAIEKVFGGGSSKGSLAIIAMAVSMRILVGALEDISKLKTKNLGESVLALMGIASGLAFIAAACQGIKFSGFAVLLSAAISLKIVVSALNDLTKIDIGNVAAGIAAIGVIFVELLGLMAVSKRVSSNSAKAGTMILEMSASLLILAQAFKILGKMDPSVLAQGIMSVSIMLGVFTAVIGFSKRAGSNTAKAGAMILEMSAAVMILAGAMAVLSLIDPAGLNQAILAVGSLSLMFGFIMGMSSYAKECKSTILAISAGIAVLSIALGALSFAEPTRLLAASASLSIVMAMFALIVKSTSTVQQANATLIILGVVTGALAYILYQLADLPIANSLAAAGSLSALMLALSTSLLIIGKVGDISKSALVGLGVMTAVTAGLAVILGVLAKCDVGPTIEIAASLSVLLLSLSASCLILSHAGAISGGAIAGIAEMTAIITAIGGLLTLIGWLMTEKFPKGQEFLTKGISLLEQIGLGLGNFAGNIVGGFLDKASEGIVSVGEHLSEFWSKASGFFEGILNVKPEALTSLGILTDVIITLTASDFLNGITNFMGTTGQSLSDFATNLPKFGKGIADFGKSVTGVDDNKVKSAANAAKVVAELQKNLPSTGGAIQSFLGEKDLTSFINNLAPLGEALSAFSSKVSDGGVDSKSVTSAANAAKVVAELENNLPATGGAIQSFFGEKDLSSFAEDLEPFGEALAAFSRAVGNGGVDSEAITSAANAAKVVAELESNLPRTGGAIQSFFGEQNLSSFTEDLVPFGEALATFSKSVSNGGVDENAVISSTNAAKIIADLENNLPKEHGVVQAFFGEQDLSSFAAKLYPFGVALSNYSNAVKSVDAEAVKNSAEAAKGLAELEYSLTASNGVWQFFTGEKSLDNFGANLKSFGDGLANLAGAVDESDVTMLETIVAKSKEILGLSDDLEGSGYATNLSNFASNLSNFGNNLAMFYASISTIDTGALSAVIGQVNRLVAMAKSMEDVDSSAMGSFGENLTKIGQNGIDSFIKAFDDCIERVKTSVDKVLNTVIDQAKSYEEKVKSAFLNLIKKGTAAIDESHDDFEAAGSNLVSAFLNAIRDTGNSGVGAVFSQIISNALSALSNTSGFNNAGSSAANAYFMGVQNGSAYGIYVYQNMAQQGVNTLQSFYNSFYNAGSWVADGFLKGIESMIRNVAIVSHNMAVEALNSAMDVLGIHSPSKEFYALGEYSDEGFIAGLKHLSGKVSSTAGSVGTTALDALSNAISGISDSVSEDVNIGPTIRPIMDLSDIQNGTNQIYGMMNGIDGYMLSGSYDFANQTLQSLNRRNSFDDPTARLANELRKTVENLTDMPSQKIENTFNITGSNAEEIADVVSRKIQMQFERRKASWA